MNTQREVLTGAQLTEARAWLTECGVNPGPWSPLVVTLAVKRHYEGGLEAFTSDTAELARLEHQFMTTAKPRADYSVSHPSWLYGEDGQLPRPAEPVTAKPARKLQASPDDIVTSLTDALSSDIALRRLNAYTDHCVYLVADLLYVDCATPARPSAGVRLAIVAQARA